MKAVAVGLENLNIISDEAYEQVQETMKANSSKVVQNEGKKSMTIQEYQFEAQMRSLDAQVGFKLIERMLAIFPRKYLDSKNVQS